MMMLRNFSDVEARSQSASLNLDQTTAGFTEPIGTAYTELIVVTATSVVRRCDTDVDEGDHGLIDHRRPVLIGGGDERENLQLFCQVCNNLKNTVCQSCPIGYHCERCTWAYPEKFHDAIVVRLTPRDATQLADEAHMQGKDPLRFAQEMFASALGKYRRKE